MKSFKQIIFVFAMVAGLALSVPANNDDQKKPPKEKPPVVDPGKKPPRGNPPKDDDKPKKPGMSFYLVSADHENNLG